MGRLPIRLRSAGNCSRAHATGKEGVCSVVIRLCSHYKHIPNTVSRTGRLYSACEMVKSSIIHKNEFAGLQLFRENRRIRGILIKMSFRADQVIAFDTKNADEIEPILMDPFRGRFADHVRCSNNPNLMDAYLG